MSDKIDLRTATGLLTTDAADLDETGAAVWIDTREVPLDELTPFPGNAKRGNVDAIRESLRKNGQYRALVVRHVPNGPMVVLAGNHTLQAFQAEGRETVRCEIVTCSDAAARRINLVDNRSADLGTYDEEALQALIQKVGDADGDYTGTGYTTEAAAEILDRINAADIDSADALADTEDAYKEQYGVIVMCTDEAHQERVYSKLQRDGYDCKVVTT